jgi:hypothetical protein
MEEMIQLHVYIKDQTKTTTKNFDMSQYKWLRSLIVALTLYNGRRGEEPARFTVAEYQDAVSGVWVPTESVQRIEDETEKILVGPFLLAFMHGKGKKFVPVLIPNYTVIPINMLLNFCKEYGIPNSSIFLFAAKATGAHCSGWHSVHDICTAAGVKTHKINISFPAIRLWKCLQKKENIYGTHGAHGKSQ